MKKNSKPTYLVLPPCPVYLNTSHQQGRLGWSSIQPSILFIQSMPSKGVPRRRFRPAGSSGKSSGSSWLWLLFGVVLIMYAWRNNVSTFHFNFFPTTALLSSPLSPLTPWHPMSSHLRINMSACILHHFLWSTRSLTQSLSPSLSMSSFGALYLLRWVTRGRYMDHL